MDNRKQDLSSYRLSQAEDSIKVAQMSYDNALFKDSINRSYYATFYAIKAVLALEEIDFKRHKDAIGYFNKTYVATEKFSKELGRSSGIFIFYRATARDRGSFAHEVGMACSFREKNLLTWTYGLWYSG